MTRTKNTAGVVDTMMRLQSLSKLLCGTLSCAEMKLHNPPMMSIAIPARQIHSDWEVRRCPSALGGIFGFSIQGVGLSIIRQWEEMALCFGCVVIQKRSVEPQQIYLDMSAMLFVHTR